MSDPDDASHALLLRLFQSEFFSPHLALSYLRTYSDSIGITYYLVEQLRTAFKPSEVEFYWAQLCHLLISKPSKSRALEYFVLQRCDESVHVALLTLWYFQASLFDLAADPSTDSFQICQRIFNQCQRLLYDDPLADTDIVASYSGSNLSFGAFKRRLRIRARTKKGEKVLPSNVLPCFVGVGSVLASVPGMPSLASFSGKMAIEQGRRKPQGRDKAPLEGSGMQRMPTGEEESSDEARSESDATSDDDDYDSDDRHAEARQREGTDEKVAGKSPTRGNLKRPDPQATSMYKNYEAAGEVTSIPPPTPKKDLQALPEQRPPIIRIGSRASSPSALKPQSPTASSSRDSANPLAQLTTSFNELRGKAASAVNDVFGQSLGVEFSAQTKDKPNGERPLWHRQPRSKNKDRRERRRASLSEKPANTLGGSAPNLMARSSLSFSPFGSTAALADENGQVTPESLLSHYDREARRRLLRSNYCRKQTEFLQTLQDVSARLLVLPKPARLSALRAELTELNRGLPSEVCFPLWCEASAQDGQETSDAIQTDVAASSGVRKGKHHRVLRINPSEAVVLNSADRVPFLLHVEVLNDDMDFDPERKQNRDSLKKLVLQEDVRRRQTAVSRNFSSPSAAQIGSSSGRQNVEQGSEKGFAHPKDISTRNSPVIPATDLFDDGNILSEPKGQHLQPPRNPPSPRLPEGDMPGENEEIDLTEQAYGSDLAAFGEEHDHSVEEEDLTNLNISHDKSTWAQAMQSSKSSDASSQSPLRNQQMQAASMRKDFSLDEYSERMRTAAIMLAQLNQSTNAAEHPIVASNPHVSSTAQGGWSSWIMGTSWAASSQAAKHSEAGQGSAGVRAAVTVGNGTANEGGAERMQSKAGAATSYGARGKAARLMNTDTEMIRKRIMHEMMALEEERMERMKVAGNRRLRRLNGSGIEDEATVQRAVNKDDPSAAMFRESWPSKKARIRAASPYGHLANWDVFSVIVKTGADLRQEQLAVQLIQEFARIWGETGSRCWVRYFRILVTSENSGIMETVTDAVSVHSIKKEAYSRQQIHALQQGAAQTQPQGGAAPKIATYSLLDHFIDTYGDPSSAKFAKARQNFIESLAGYSILSYLLQIKDRHNGNILLDGEGHMIHIDFGFMLGISPGGVGFEAAPFKMPQEYIDIIGGLDSPKFVEFKSLVCQGFRDVRKHAERVIMMVELMQKDSRLPCFALGDLTAGYLRDRFQLALSQSQCDDFVDRLITSSLNSTFTRLYDQYQYYSEGILS